MSEASAALKIALLDSLFDSIVLEQHVAEKNGAELARWDGDPCSVADVDVVAHVRTPVDAPLIAAMPTCRVIARFGTGLDTVDLDTARRAGIAVVGVRDYCLPELASQTLSLAFALSRRLLETANALDRPWDEVAQTTPLQRRQNALVVGFGAVGARVAAALLALDYNVTVTSAHAQDEALALGAQVEALDDALPTADIVFLHTALTPENTRLINRERLERMKPQALLVNTARLALLDEEAVAAALEDGPLGGLGLDASLSPASPLRRVAHLPNVVITPHVGWLSNESADELRRRTIEDALRVARTHDPLEVPKR